VRFSDQGVSDRPGVYKFQNKVVLAPCELATDPNFLEFLTVQVMEPDKEQDDVMCIVGTAYVNLTLHLPTVVEQWPKRADDAPEDGIMYRSAPLLRAGSEEVGRVSYIIRVIDRAVYKEDGPEIQKQNAAFTENMSQLLEKLDRQEDEAEPVKPAANRAPSFRRTEAPLQAFLATSKSVTVQPNGLSVKYNGQTKSDMCGVVVGMVI